MSDETILAYVNAQILSLKGRIGTAEKNLLERPTIDSLRSQVVYLSGQLFALEKLRDKIAMGMFKEGPGQ